MRPRPSRPWQGEGPGPGGGTRQPAMLPDLKILAWKQAGQAFPGDAPGAGAPFDPGNPTVTNHAVDGASGDNQDRGRLIRPKIPFIVQ